MTRTIRNAGLIATLGIALIGFVLVGVAFARTQDPRDWLDDNATRTGDDAWTAPEEPLRFADRIASHARPESRVVTTWGVALRYERGTLTVTAGTSPGTTAIYWDGHAGRGVRYYRLGRWSGGRGGFDPIPTDQDTPDGSPRTGAAAAATADLVQTRRGEDFRGGGPGGGK